MTGSSDAERVKELERALREAILSAHVAMSFVDEQAGRFFSGQRPNWKKAAIGAFDEFDGKLPDWNALLSEPVEGLRQGPVR